MVRRGSETYGRFAGYYDFIYQDLVDYEGDVEFLEALFRRNMGRRPAALLDLGCGTGNHDLPLARRGYEVTGIDLSAAQLGIARSKARAARLAVRFIRADMRSFDLGRRFDVAVCMFGAFGYLTKTSDVVRCLQSVRRHLREDGLFVYEFWHRLAVAPRADWFHKVGPAYELVRLGNGRFDSRRGLLTIEFRFFVLRGSRVLDRFDETHTIRTYPIPEMRRLLERTGFDLLAAYAATPKKKTFHRARHDTFRVMAVARPRAGNLK